MKTITALIGFAFLLITACILYLVKEGVSLRSAPIIKPSVISQDFHNVPDGIFIRLFPDLQKSHFLVWGVSQNNQEVQKTLSIMKELYEKEFRTDVHFIYQGEDITPSDLQKCPKPCWILVPENKGSALGPRSWLLDQVLALDPDFISISWVPFQRDVQVPESCVQEKRLDLDCLKVLSVQEVAKKFKEKNQRYFLMRKYMDHDYFLFIEGSTL